MKVQGNLDLQLNQLQQTIVESGVTLTSESADAQEQVGRLFQDAGVIKYVGAGGKIETITNQSDNDNFLSNLQSSAGAANIGFDPTGLPILSGSKVQDAIASIVNELDAFTGSAKVKVDAIKKIETEDGVMGASVTCTSDIANFIAANAGSHESIFIMSADFDNKKFVYELAKYKADAGYTATKDAWITAQGSALDGKTDQEKADAYDVSAQCKADVKTFIGNKPEDSYGDKNYLVAKTGTVQDGLKGVRDFAFEGIVDVNEYVGSVATQMATVQGIATNNTTAINNLSTQVSGDMGAMTLQNLYEQTLKTDHSYSDTDLDDKTKKGMASIKLKPGKAFEIADDDTTGGDKRYFRVDPVSDEAGKGRVHIFGELFVEGSTVKIDSTINDAENWSVTPKVNSTVPAISVTPEGASIDQSALLIKVANAGDAKLEVTATGLTKIADLLAANLVLGTDPAGDDVATLLSGLRSDMGLAEVDINTNKSGVATNLASLSTQNGLITGLRTDTDKNSGDIANNIADIAQQKIDLEGTINSKETSITQAFQSGDAAERALYEAADTALGVRIDNLAATAGKRHTYSSYGQTMADKSVHTVEFNSVGSLQDQDFASITVMQRTELENASSPMEVIIPQSIEFSGLKKVGETASTRKVVVKFSKEMDCAINLVA